MWRLWGKFYSNGKLHGLMRKFRRFPRLYLIPMAFSCVLSLLSTPQLAVSGGPLRAGAAIFLILFQPSHYSAKGVAVKPDLWHGTAIPDGDLAAWNQLLP
jgi:hypothetical protein